MTKNILFSLSLLLSVASFAKDILPTTEERIEAIRRAEVWFSPSWIDKDLNFSDTFSVTPGPVLNELQKRLQLDTIDCNLVPDGISATTGFTQKFVCNLLQLDAAGKPSLVLDEKQKPI